MALSGACVVTGTVGPQLASVCELLDELELLLDTPELLDALETLLDALELLLDTLEILLDTLEALLETLDMLLDALDTLAAELLEELESSLAEQAETSRLINAIAA
jgi:hypothetical protein